MQRTVNPRSLVRIQEREPISGSQVRALSGQPFKTMKRINLKDWLSYVEKKKIELGISTDGDEYKNQGLRTSEKQELLNRIEERKNTKDL